MDLLCGFKWDDFEHRESMSYSKAAKAFGNLLKAFEGNSKWRLNFFQILVVGDVSSKEYSWAKSRTIKNALQIYCAARICQKKT